MSALSYTRAQYIAATSKSRCCRQGTKRGLVVSCSANDRNGQQSGQNAPVFQLDSRHNLTMADVRDAYEVCSLIPDPNERHQCYSVFGVDAHRMATYYERVVQLEDQLQADYHETHSAPCVFLTEDDPDDYLQAPAECSLME